MKQVKGNFDKSDVNFMKFPLFIDISNKKILVVGAGNIALRRINTLLKFGCIIDVISESFLDDDIFKKVNCLQKKFEKSDITDDYFMVIGATNNRLINHSIYELCINKNVFVSIADCKEECNFYFPAICINDELSIGVVSDGNNHSLVRKTAKKIRRVINEKDAQNRQQRK